jgi:phosphomannomutase
MNRVGHAFIKRRMREEDAVFGGEVTGPLLLPRLLLRGQRLHPALLILELMSRKNMTLHDLLKPLREKVLHLRRNQHAVSDIATVKARLAALADRYKDGNTYTLDGFSAEFPDWHFNVRGIQHRAHVAAEPGGPDPELMASKRDEVLALIRA